MAYDRWQALQLYKALLDDWEDRERDVASIRDEIEGLAGALPAPYPRFVPGGAMLSLAPPFYELLS